MNMTIMNEMNVTFEGNIAYIAIENKKPIMLKADAFEMRSGELIALINGRWNVIRLENEKLMKYPVKMIKPGLFYGKVDGFKIWTKRGIYNTVLEVWKK